MATDNSFLPSNEVATNIDTTNLSGLTVNSQGRVFAIDSSGTTDTIVQIDPVTVNINTLGIIRDVLGFNYDGTILQLAFDANDDLLIISNSNGFATASSYVLMQIDKAELEGTDDYLTAHSPTSAVLARKTLTGISAPATSTLAGFAYNAVDGNFYVVTRDTVANENHLYRFTATGATAVEVTKDATSTGIDLATSTLTIDGIGFDAAGNLILQGKNSGIDTTLFTTAITTPDSGVTYEYNFTLATAASAGNDDIDTFAMGIVSGNEIAFGYTVPGTNASLFQSATAGSLTSILGEINLNAASFEFNQTLSLLLGDNQFGSSLTVVDTNTTYLVTTGQTPHLWMINGANALTDLGQLTDTHGTLVQISSITYDSVNSKLIGIDSTMRRLVSINTDNATVTAMTESGSVASTVTDLEYNTSGDLIGLSEGQAITFLGTTMEQLGGINARRISYGDITAPNYTTTPHTQSFSGRIVTNTSNDDRVYEIFNIRGDFDGTIAANNLINNISVISSDFNGSVVSEDLNFFNLGNNSGLPETFGTDAIIDTHDYNYQTILFGDSDGTIHVGRSNILQIHEGASSNSNIIVDHNINQFTAYNSFDGHFQSNTAINFTSAQTLGDNAHIVIDGDTSLLTLTGGTRANSMIQINGDVGSINATGTHQGTISIFGTVANATFTDIDSAIFNVALGGTNLNITGTVSDSYLLYGSWLGADGKLNTGDDMITGGSLTNATINTMVDTVLAAGVLPAAGRGQVTPGQINAFFFDDHTEIVNGQSTFISVESGGILPSSIDNVTVTKASNTDPNNGQYNLIVATDSVPQLINGTQNNVIHLSTYNDRPGGPQVVSTTQVSDSVIEIVFNEELNANSISLSSDGDGDNAITIGSGFDVAGSITLYDYSTSTTILNNVEFEYLTRTNSVGNLVGVVRLKSTAFDGFSPLTRITISDGSDGHAALLDRSGSTGSDTGAHSRSALSDFNQDGVVDTTNGVVDDIAGTVIDGDSDGFAGGIYETITQSGFIENGEFITALLDLQDLEANTEALWTGPINTAGANIFAFEASADQFFSYSYSGFDQAVIGLFKQDDQGTANIGDDTFELVANYENTQFGYDSNNDTFTQTNFQALQLPEDGTYFLVVDSVSFGFDFAINSEFELLVELTDFASNIDIPVDSFGDPIDEIIGYQPGTTQNAAKQLVYLNFEGGTATEFTDGFGNAIDPISIDAFNIEDTFASLLNNADHNETLTDNIIRNIYTIYAQALGFDNTWLYDNNGLDGLASIGGGVNSSD
ncbi:MAG: hypothetical protein JKX85_10490, partial [Phycisphaeraceae bacterium]|nr:hypothetical protein [Phycisphaeraceae bacterium]